MVNNLSRGLVSSSPVVAQHLWASSALRHPASRLLVRRLVRTRSGGGGSHHGRIVPVESDRLGTPVCVVDQVDPMSIGGGGCISHVAVHRVCLLLTRLVRDGGGGG